MSKPTWKDATSYSRNDKDRIPQTWEIDLGGNLKLGVTRHRHYESDQWLFYCHQLNLEEPLNYRGDDPRRAHIEAANKVRAWLTRITKRIDAL